MPSSSAALGGQQYSSAAKQQSKPGASNLAELDDMLADILKKWFEVWINFKISWCID